jgi:hypothetical protein
VLTVKVEESISFGAAALIRSINIKVKANFLDLPEFDIL